MISDPTQDDVTGLLNRQAFLEQVREAQNSLPVKVRRGCLLILHFPVVQLIVDSDGEQAAADALRHLLAIIETRLRSRDTLGRIGRHSLCIFLRQCREADAKIVADQHTALLRDVVLLGQDKAIPLDFRYRIIPLDARGSRMNQGVSRVVSAPELSEKPALLKSLSVGGNNVDLSASTVVSLKANRTDEAASLTPARTSGQTTAELFTLGATRDSQSHRLRPGILIRRKALTCCMRLQSVGLNQKTEQLQDSAIMGAILDILALNPANKRPVLESQAILPISASQLNIQFPEWIRHRCQLLRVAPSDICLSISADSLSDELRALAPILRELNRAGVRLMIEDVSSASQFKMLFQLAMFDYLYISARRLQTSLRDVNTRLELEALIAQARQEHSEICCAGIDSQALMKLAYALNVEIGFGRACGASIPFPSLN